MYNVIWLYQCWLYQCYPHRHSTTVSLGTFHPLLFICITYFYTTSLLYHRGLKVCNYNSDSAAECIYSKYFQIHYNHADKIPTMLIHLQPEKLRYSFWIERLCYRENGVLPHLDSSHHPTSSPTTPAPGFESR